jgi:hypothetical protein
MEPDEFGKKIWKHKTNKRMFLEQSYRWKNKLTLIEEFEDERTVVMQFNTVGFDFSAWTPISQSEFNSIRNFYREIYN